MPILFLPGDPHRHVKALFHQLRSAFAPKPGRPRGHCMVCGCTDGKGCPGGCW
jgi:hypothetical protein